MRHGTLRLADDTYEVLGSLHQALSGVQQSLRQLSAWHARHAQFAATDDGNREAGQEYAVKASALVDDRCVLHRGSTPAGDESPVGERADRVAARPAHHRFAEHLTALPEALSQREAALNPGPPASSSNAAGQGFGLSR